MSLTTFPGTGAELEEPDWEVLIPNEGKKTTGRNGRWRERAHRDWLRVTAALREAGTLAPENAHQVQRLVIAYVRYDRAAANAFKLGMVIPSPRTETPMVNLWQVEMRQADSDATTAEMELGITPRRRGAVTKAKRAEKVQRPSDRYLRPLS